MLYYTRITFTQSGKKIIKTNLSLGADPKNCDEYGRFMLSHNDALRLINKWNAQAFYTISNDFKIPYHLYYLQSENV